MLSLPVTTPLLPYPTLFRSAARQINRRQCVRQICGCLSRLCRPWHPHREARAATWFRVEFDAMAKKAAEAVDNGKTQAERSEEHTSELQSPCNLVCRLLLET